MQLIDLTGRRFGKLVAIERSPSRDYGTSRATMWRCACDCGRASVVYGAALRRGLTRCAAGGDWGEERDRKDQDMNNKNDSAAVAILRRIEWAAGTTGPTCPSCRRMKPDASKAVPPEHARVLSPRVLDAFQGHAESCELAIAIGAPRLSDDVVRRAKEQQERERAEHRDGLMALGARLEATAQTRKR